MSLVIFFYRTITAMDPMDVINERTLNELIAEFKNCDKDNKGVIPVAEVMKIIFKLQKTYQIDDSDARSMVTDLDPQGDVEFVSFPDFLLMMTKKLMRNSETEIIESFRTFEQKGGDKGTISPATLFHVLGSVGSELSRVSPEVVSSSLKLKSEDETINYQTVVNNLINQADTMDLREEIFAED